MSIDNEEREGVPRLVRDSRTEKMRRLQNSDFSEPYGGGVPKASGVRREESGAMAAAAVAGMEIFLRDKLKIDNFDEAVRPQLSSIAEIYIDKAIDKAVSRIDEIQDRARSNEPSSHDGKKRYRASSGWIAFASVICLAFATVCAIALLSIWSRVDSIERRVSDDEVYTMIVANWLVTEASTNYKRAKNNDEMLRIIAQKVGADVSGIPSPSETHPPGPVQKLNSDYIYQDN